MSFFFSLSRIFLVDKTLKKKKQKYTNNIQSCFLLYFEFKGGGELRIHALRFKKFCRGRWVVLKQCKCRIKGIHLHWLYREKDGRVRIVISKQSLDFVFIPRSCLKVYF